MTGPRIADTDLAALARDLAAGGIVIGLRSHRGLYTARAYGPGGRIVHETIAGTAVNALTGLLQDLRLIDPVLS